MANYLGNATLSPAVRDRVLSTFQQALTLFKQGRTDEVIQGCGLILRMDPMFDPAKKLLEKARNPAAPIDIDALAASAGSEPPAGDLMQDARAAMAARDYQRVVTITTAVLSEDLLNDEARVLNEQAREKMEAAPFVEQFARKFDQQLAAGNPTAAKAELEKARALDADHPSIARMQGALTASAPPPAAPQSFSFDSPSPSFVIDNPTPPPAGGRTAAQAVDFGFTFEEEKAPAEKPSAFSFDTPPAAGGGFSFGTPAPSAEPSGAQQPAAAAPEAFASNTFDFSTASVETSADDQKKIAQYLADGDRASDSGDYQKAIDLWSRIFLIDVTNDEASQRIERAKARRREVEQRVEGIVAAGVAAFEKNDRESARARMEEALSLDPTNQTAQDYLDRLSATVAEGGAAARETPFIPPPSTTRDIFDDALDYSGNETPLMPPEPAAARSAAAGAAAKSASKAPVKSTSKGRSMNLIIGVAVVVLLGAGGWFAWTRYMSRPAYDPAATQSIFKQATALAQKGKFDQAIGVLQDVKPDDPQHDKALMMIADLQKKKSQASEMIDGRPAAVVYQESLAAGKQAFEAHDYDAAKKAFDTASRIKALPPDIAPLYDQATQQVAKLDAAKSLFKEQKYAEAIANLQPLLAADPQNRSIQRIITDAHFNLGAQALQDERADRTQDAITEFDEVLKTDPNDELARRSRALAERYNGQAKDLLYKIYVKYLPLRRVG